MRESDELVSAFTELETFVRETSRLPGLAAARSEADRRRRGRLAVWSAAAAAFLVLAGTAVVANWLPRSGDTGLEPSPWVTAEPTPSGTRGPLPMVLLSDMTPSDQLRNAVLDVPTLNPAGCPDGRIQFVDGAFGSVESGGRLVMDVAAYGDIDADGNDDVVVALNCTVLFGNHGVTSTQVVAYSGPERTLLAPLTAGNDILVTGLQVHPDGAVDVGLASVGSSRVQIGSMVFDRFHWTGSTFDLIYHVDVSEEGLPGAEVTASPATLQLTPGGPAQIVEVTVRNNRLSLPWPMRLDLGTSAPVTVEVEGSANVVDGTARKLLITTPNAGQTVTITLRVALPAGATLPDGASMSVIAWAYPIQASVATIDFIPA
jgi:hypothetical protein